jgi:hypothetical protein
MPQLPTPVRNTFYKGMHDFTAWSPWGDSVDFPNRPIHNKKNLDYIPIKDEFVKQMNYPAELQRLIDKGWTAAEKRNGPRPANVPQIGAAHRKPVPPGFQERPSPLRTGMGRPLGLLASWKHIQEFEQVAAYTYRGDTRAPEAIHGDGGFNPPSMRTDDYYVGKMAEQFAFYLERLQGANFQKPDRDQIAREIVDYVKFQVPPTYRMLLVQYELWRQILEKEEMHLMNMTVDSFMKGYISASRDPLAAKGGSTGVLGGAGVKTESYGWIYVLRIRSGFLIKKGVFERHGYKTKTKESEIAHLGPLSWDDVMGFVYCAPSSDGNVYIRNMFHRDDPEAFRQLLAGLSSTLPRSVSGWN